MNDIDWSKAPEGATHWEPETDKVLASWMKLSEDGWYYWPPHVAVTPEWQRATRVSQTRIDAMIARPTTPNWNGEGLPPVGVVCECQNDKFQWLRGRIVYVGSDRGDKLAVMQADTEMLYGSAGEFRPIRTPEQIAAEKREVAVKELVDRFALYAHPDIQWRALFAQMYDCGCRMIAEENK